MMKLSEALEGYWLDKGLDFSPRSIPTYKIAFSHLITCLGDVQIENIQANDIRRFLLWLRDERKVSKRTVYDYWARLSSLWTWAEKELEIPHIVRDKVRRPNYTKTMVDPLTIEQIGQLLKAASYDATGTALCAVGRKKFRRSAKA